VPFGIVLCVMSVQLSVHKAYESLDEMGVSDTSQAYNTNLKEFLEFCNMLDVCEYALLGALKRDVSVGAHYIV